MENRLFLLTVVLLSPVAKGRGISMKRAVLYLRVSTTEQTTANQEHELREIAARMGCEVVRVYRDHGISGAKGRDGRPEFDRLCRDAAKRQFDLERRSARPQPSGPGRFSFRIACLEDRSVSASARPRHHREAQGWRGLR